MQVVVIVLIKILLQISVKMILQRLDGVVDYIGAMENKANDRQSETCGWSESNPTIRSWLDSTSDCSRLWVHGHPGTGKSTLATWLIEHVRTHLSPNEIIVYFFCEGHHERKSSESILKAFIEQVLQVMTEQCHKKIIDQLASDIEVKGPSYRFTVRDLSGYLESLLLSFTKSRCALFLTDASF